MFHIHFANPFGFLVISETSQNSLSLFYKVISIEIIMKHDSKWFWIVLLVGVGGCGVMRRQGIFKLFVESFWNGYLILFLGYISGMELS